MNVICGDGAGVEALILNDTKSVFTGEVGTCVGLCEGDFDVGLLVGLLEGDFEVGTRVGLLEGDCEVGARVGLLLGDLDVGFFVGDILGAVDGLLDGDLLVGRFYRTC